MIYYSSIGDNHIRINGDIVATVEDEYLRSGIETYLNNQEEFMDEDIKEFINYLKDENIDKEVITELINVKQLYKNNNDHFDEINEGLKQLHAIEEMPDIVRDAIQVYIEQLNKIDLPKKNKKKKATKR